MRRRPLNRRFVLLVGLGALAVALVAFGVLRPASTKPREAPALPARTLAGKPVTLAGLRGHSTAVVFWASWCGDCHVEAAAVERFARSAAGRGRVIGVDYSDGGDWRKFLHEYDWSFPVFGDPDGTLGAAFGIHALPTTVVLDARGRIVSSSAAVQTVSSLTRALADAA
jgi:cytochrome c biogenesis protein CcmG, thiol:disulfide interchange protein DsbE